jgi:hypothetical protein
MFVMIVVRTFPDTARGEREQTVNPEQSTGELVFPVNCSMLLIVVNNKHANIQQACAYARNDLNYRMRWKHREKERCTQQYQCYY